MTNLPEKKSVDAIPETIRDSIRDELAGAGEGWGVYLYNDSAHLMSEVTEQITRAIACSQKQAWHIMLEALSNGSALVTITGKSHAEQIADMLKEIGLTVEIKPL